VSRPCVPFFSLCAQGFASELGYALGRSNRAVFPPSLASIFPTIAKTELLQDTFFTAPSMRRQLTTGYWLPSKYPEGLFSDFFQPLFFTSSRDPPYSSFFPKRLFEHRVLFRFFIPPRTTLNSLLINAPFSDSSRFLPFYEIGPFFTPICLRLFK